MIALEIMNDNKEKDEGKSHVTKSVSYRKKKGKYCIMIN